MKKEQVKDMARIEVSERIDSFFKYYNEKMIDYMIDYYNELEEEYKTWECYDISPLDDCDEPLMWVIRDEIEYCNICDYLAYIWDEIPNIIIKRNRNDIAYKTAVLGE